LTRITIFYTFTYKKLQKYSKLFNLKDKTQRLIEKSRDAIEAAEILLQAKKNNLAAGRVYYAMFYLAEALLYEKGYEFHKHSGL